MSFVRIYTYKSLKGKFINFSSSIGSEEFPVLSTDLKSETNPQSEYKELICLHRYFFYKALRQKILKKKHTNMQSVPWNRNTNWVHLKYVNQTVDQEVRKLPWMTWVQSFANLTGNSKYFRLKRQAIQILLNLQHEPFFIGFCVKLDWKKCGIFSDTYFIVSEVTLNWC